MVTSPPSVSLWEKKHLLVGIHFVFHKFNLAASLCSHLPICAAYLTDSEYIKLKAGAASLRAVSQAFLVTTPWKRQAFSLPLSWDCYWVTMSSRSGSSSVILCLSAATQCLVTDRLWRSLQVCCSSVGVSALVKMQIKFLFSFVAGLLALINWSDWPSQQHTGSLFLRS